MLRHSLTRCARSTLIDHMVRTLQKLMTEGMSILIAMITMVTLTA
jgi:hypothetical protein